MLFPMGAPPPQNASERPGAHFQMIGPNYFRALGIPVLKGRSFTEQDIAATTPVAIINETMVRRFFPKENPMGKRLLVEALISGKMELGPPVAWEIVGIVGDIKVSGLGEKEPSPELYVPYSQSPW